MRITGRRMARNKLLVLIRPPFFNPLKYYRWDGRMSIFLTDFDEDLSETAGGFRDRCVK
jgi:hypothetical protein